MVQGVSKKRYFFNFYLISVLEVRFYFFTCVLESEFGARFNDTHLESEVPKIATTTKNAQMLNFRLAR